MKYLEKINNKIIENKKNTFIFLLIIALISSIPAFLTIGIADGHDTYFHLSRIAALKDSYKLGVFNPSIYPNYLKGYGYANPLFYPDLFLNIPAFLSYLGLNTIISYKIFLILINIATSFTIYITVLKISKNKKSANFSALIYTFSSYRLVDMYIRGALGETIAFIFLPLVILGIYNIIYGDYKKIHILIIGMCGIILSHVITTYMIFFVLLILLIINIKKLLKEKKRIGYLLLAALITLLLTSYYLFPMLEQLLNGKFTLNNLNEDYKLITRAIFPVYLITEFPYFLSPWIPPGIGLIYLYIIILKIQNKGIKDKFLNICFILGIVFLLVSSTIFPWNTFQKMLSLIQFPWRFYLIATCFLAIFSGVIIENKKSNKILVILLAIIPLITTSVSLKLRGEIKRVDEYYISMAEYLPLKVNLDYLNERDDIISLNEIETDLDKKGTNLTIKFDKNYQDNKLEVPLIYYKGYSAYLNDKKIDVYETENGLVGVDIKDESGIIKISYEGTTIQKLSKQISLITLILYTIYLIKRGEL